MTAYPGKGGQILEYTVESALGTAGTAYAIRIEEGFDFPTAEKSLSLPAQLGRANWANTEDNPVTFEQYQESIVKVPYYIRGHATASTKPPLVSLLESAGLSANKSTSTNLDGYTSGIAFSASSGSATPGSGFALQVDDGNHWPFVVANAPGTAAFDYIPGYEIPGSIATPANNDIYGAYVITPRARQVPTNATVSFNFYTRQQHTSNQMKFTASGCALAEVPKLTFEPGKPVKMDLSFHAADVALSDTAYTGGSTTIVDQDEHVVWGGTSSQFGFGNSNAAGGISAGTYNLIKGEVDFSNKVVPIVGTGTTGTLNNCQGYMSVPGHAKVTLDLLCDATFWTDISASTFQRKYIHFAQAGSTSRPFFGAFFPRCQQVEAPQLVDKRGDYYQVKLVYMASYASWNGSTTVDTDYGAPWAMVLGRAVAAA